MVSYRGYGASEGLPSEEGIKRDAAAALAYARDRNDVVDISRLYLFGRSIGGACAIATAAKSEAQNALRGIVVENTFTSINDMIDAIMPALRFAKSLNRNKWDSLAKIRSIRLPLLLIRYGFLFFFSGHKIAVVQRWTERLITDRMNCFLVCLCSGLKDELCPPQHMRILHANAISAKFKVMHTVANGEHNVRCFFSLAMTSAVHSVPRKLTMHFLSCDLCHVTVCTT